MNANIRCLIQACKDLGINYKVMHPSENLVIVENALIFTNWATPLISHAMARLLLDKDYTQNCLKGAMAIPKYKSYLTPRVERFLTQQFCFDSCSDIVSDIETSFSYPLIVKRNGGTRGQNVFLVTNHTEALSAVNAVFNEDSKNWDFIAIAQEYVRPAAEYRVITLFEKLEFAYLKDNSHATYQDNLSPLHWNGSKATQVTDNNILAKLAEFIAPIFQTLHIPYCGLDIIQDDRGKLWLIEINGSPGFDLFTRDNGDEQVVNLFKKILNARKNFQFNT